MKQKRADLTSTQLITIILLVAGFVIVVFFYFYSQLGYSGTVDKEVCHESVILRGTLPAFLGMKEYVPLKCKTEKICITSGFIGGRCKNSYGEKESILKVKVKNIKDIEKFISGNIVECWKTYGEGKILLNTQWIAQEYGIGDVVSSCNICSRIAFDYESLNKIKISSGDISKINVMNYMATHYMPNSKKTYLDVMGKEGGKFAGKRIDDWKISNFNIETDDKTKEESVTPSGIAITSSDVTQEIKNPENPPDLSIMFMQVTAPSHSGVLLNTALGVLGIQFASFALAPGTTTKLVKGAFSAWRIVLPLAAIFAIYQQGNVYYQKSVTAGYCGDVSTGEEAREGCSVVRMANYDVSDIRQYCGIIETIP